MSCLVPFHFQIPFTKHCNGMIFLFGMLLSVPHVRIADSASQFPQYHLPIPTSTFHLSLFTSDIGLEQTHTVRARGEVSAFPPIPNSSSQMCMNSAVVCSVLGHCKNIYFHNDSSENSVYGVLQSLISLWTGYI